MFAPDLSESEVYHRRRPCHVTISSSNPGLEINKVEETTHGSEHNFIILRGMNHLEVDTRRSINQFIYIEAKRGSNMWPIHCFCPQLNRVGYWLTRIGIWNEKSTRYSSNANLFNSCPSPLVGASVKSAYIEFPCKWKS